VDGDRGLGDKDCASVMGTAGMQSKSRARLMRRRYRWGEADGLSCLGAVGVRALGPGPVSLPIPCGRDPARIGREHVGHVSLV